MKKSFEIESDCLDIVQRIKAIDSSYFVVYNLENNSFELHSHEQRASTYCLTFPFDVLDERSVLYTLKTRVQNSDKLFEEMERQNKELEKTNIKQIFNDFEEKMYDS